MPRLGRAPRQHSELARSPCLGALLDRDADEIAPFGPGAVVVLDIPGPQQLVQDEPSVGRALADPAVGDHWVLVGEDAVNFSAL